MKRKKSILPKRPKKQSLQQIVKNQAETIAALEAQVTDLNNAFARRFSEQRRRQEFQQERQSALRDRRAEWAKDARKGRVMGAAGRILGGMYAGGGENFNVSMSTAIEKAFDLDDAVCSRVDAE